MRHLGPWILSSIAGLTACADPPKDVRAPSVDDTLGGPIAWDVLPATEVQLSGDVVPDAYDLLLRLDPRKATFSGKTRITASVVRPTDQIVLHGRDLTIQSASVRAHGAALRPEVRTRRAFGAKQHDEELVLLLGKRLEAGKIDIEIAYEAPFGSLWGLFKVEDGGRSLAFTQLESTYARRMFPSFDEPRFKTPFTLTLEVPEGMSAYANTGATGEEAGAPGSKRVRFAATEPIPTYLVAIAVGQLEAADGPKTPAPIRLIAAPGRAKLGQEGMEAAARTLASLESYFGRPYPYGKLDVVAVPNFAVGAMENAGLVTFREELLLTTADSPTLLRRRMALIMAHELAHQWFGNLVTMKWWDDLWLNEGFATWMQAKVCDDAFPGFGARAEQVLSRDYAMRADVLPSARPVRQLVDESDEIQQVGGWSAYQKGAAVLGMLEAWRGESAFRDAIRAYVNAQAHKSVTSDELFAALGADDKLPVAKVARSFLDQPGVPLVEASLTCDPKSSRGPVTVTLRQYALGGSPGARWAVPVCLRVSGENEARCTLLEGEEGRVTLPKCPAWIYPNAGESGYYRFDLDAGSWDKLVRAASDLSEPERAGLLLDAWALVLAGRRGVEDVVALLRAVDWNRERSRVVVEAAIAVLGELDRTFVDDTSRAAFAKLTRRVLGPQEKRLKLPRREKPETDGDRLMRAAVLGALHDLDAGPEVGKSLAAAAEAYLDDPGKAAVLVGPDLGPLAARANVAQGGKLATLLDEARLSAARTPEHRVGLTIAMASRKDPAALRAVLEMLRTGAIRAGDFRHVKNAVSRNVQSREVFYRWAASNLEELVGKMGGASTLTHTVAWSCGKEPGADAFAAEVEKRLATLEGARRSFEEGADERARCGRIRDREREAFAQALAKEK
jgi:alanyl aminopeptidase